MAYQQQTFFQGITNTLTRKKIRKCREKLGNGHDAELHVTVADLYQHLGENALALESYHAAVTSLLKQGMPLKQADSDNLIALYKHILRLSPLHEEIAEKLGQEYLRRGLTYRAVELHTLFAERYIKRGEYQRATQHYQTVFAIEPGSITARITCALLFCQLRDYPKAAEQYGKIGDIYFEHQRYEGASEYYQQAVALDPDALDFRQKLSLTRHLLNNSLTPHMQAGQPVAEAIRLDVSALERSLAEKERIEQELRQNIEMLKRRHARAARVKQEQLRAAQQRLDELSAHVAAMKDDMEHVAGEKQRVETLLRQEVEQKRELERKLAQLGAFAAAESSQPPVSERRQRLESAVARLDREKSRLEDALQRKLEAVSQRETDLRGELQEQTARGGALEQQLAAALGERTDVERRFDALLQDSLKRERLLQTQVQNLIRQHEDTMKQIAEEKQAYEGKYRQSQARMNRAETDTMAALQQLDGELARQCRREDALSQQFQSSLREITQLLRHQEQEIRTLEQF